MGNQPRRNAITSSRMGPETKLGMLIPR